MLRINADSSKMKLFTCIIGTYESSKSKFESRIF